MEGTVKLAKVVGRDGITSQSGGEGVSPDGTFIRNCARSRRDSQSKRRGRYQFRGRLKSRWCYKTEWLFKVVEEASIEGKGSVKARIFKEDKMLKKGKQGCEESACLECVLGGLEQ